MVSKKSKLIFLMPPKTASNSLRKSLLDSEIVFDSFDPNYHKPNTHLYLSELIENFKIENPEEFRIFQIFRNPLEKFVSAFYHFRPHMPNYYFISKIGLNEFVLFYQECLKSENYVSCMYDDPLYVQSMINKKIHFGFTRYFVEQNKWNNLNMKINYIDFRQINSSFENFGINIPQLEYENVNPIKKETLNETSERILKEIYEKDFFLFN